LKAHRIDPGCIGEQWASLTTGHVGLLLGSGISSLIPLAYQLSPYNIITNIRLIIL